jgi:hypothetical protein
MPSKQQLTQQLLTQLPLDERPIYQFAIRTWGQDSRDDGGLRLSPYGLDVFKLLKIEPHEFDFSRALSPSVLMTLSRKLDCPYYIKGGKTSRLILFGSKQSVMYAMYGDLEKFLRYLDRT